MNKRSLLFFDDKQRLLQGLQRTLSGMRQEWDRVLATRASEALDLMKKGPFVAAVADRWMPGMDEIQLLNEVKEGC